MNKWTQQEAIELCRAVEAICVPCGCHVALTGGLLYKEGLRKDCDLLFYRIRQAKQIDIEKLWKTLRTVGIVWKSGFGFCHKAEHLGRSIDCLFPEEDGDYIPEDKTPVVKLPA